MCGIRTEQCCETTTRVGGDLGYEVTFVTDATATDRRTAAPGRRPAAGTLADPSHAATADVIARTEYALAGRFATADHRQGADRIVTQVVFLLVPRVHLLDLAGPAQVFSTAADFGAAYELRYVAEQEDVPTARVCRCGADTTWPDARRRRPGRGARAGASPTAQPAQRPPTVDAPAGCAEHHDRGGGIVASVCAGADALGRAGLLDGRRCTTHHDLQDELARRYPRATVVRDVLYVVDGRVVTSAGIASGIDLALHLSRSGTAPASPPGSPARWSSTPAATATSTGQRDAAAPRPPQSTSCTGPRTSSTPGSPTPRRCATWPEPAGSAHAP